MKTKSFICDSFNECSSQPSSMECRCWTTPLDILMCYHHACLCMFSHSQFRAFLTENSHLGSLLSATTSFMFLYLLPLLISWTVEGDRKEILVNFLFPDLLVTPKSKYVNVNLVGAINKSHTGLCTTGRAARTLARNVCLIRAPIYLLLSMFRLLSVERQKHVHKFSEKKTNYLP